MIATLRNSVRRDTGARGQALVEFAFMLPLLFLLIVCVVDMAGFLFAWITVANAARAGVQYAILGGVSAASVTVPTPPSGTSIVNLITQDVLSLPNNSSIIISVCENNNATITSVVGNCSNVPADPEPLSYVLATVDVTYTYQPLIPAFDFSGMGISLPTTFLSPMTVHRRAVMRMIQ